MRMPLLLAAGALAFAPAPSQAQVSGTVIIGGGPVGGVIHVGEPRYRREVVVVERRAPRVIVVERVYRHKHKRHPIWRYRDRGRYERVIVYYDRRHDRYYDRHRPGLVEIHVVARGGRYYRLYDDDRRRYRDDDDRRYDRDDYDRRSRR
jgi:hypothetical protein